VIWRADCERIGMALTDQLSAQLDRLAAIEPGPFPFVSLYLNMQANQHGRDYFEPFLRKELPGRVRTYPAGAPERESLETDVKRITGYVTSVDASANGLAIFACGGADLFEAITLAAPIDEHRVYISDQPHLYPLARVLDQFPRYAVLLADSTRARIFVVAGNTMHAAREVEGVKTKRHKMGGWSQARYQRHIENYHQQHIKEVVDTLGRVVADEGIGSVVIAGEESIVSWLREEMPKDLAARVVDVMRLDVHAPERDILEATRAAIRESDAATDRERVAALLDAYRADGLGVVGVEGTLRALEMGQVDELVITAVPDTIDAGEAAEQAQPGERSAEERAADQLIAKARQTAAKTRFIEDGSLLAAVGGVGAFLRFKI
jgi:peptide chain release factor subunit 1